METLNGMFDLRNDKLLPSLFTLINDAKALHEAMEVRYYMITTENKNAFIRLFLYLSEYGHSCMVLVFIGFGDERKCAHSCSMSKK